jgi:hypothetical protein
MEAQEAIQKAQAHLQNAMELVPRPVGKEELLYMWDNQITALDNFLAETEAISDKVLKTWRGKLRDAKKKLTDSVMLFEAQQEGEELPEDDEPTPEEWMLSYKEMAGDMIDLARESLEETVKKVDDLVKWEEPLAVINGFLADSEPFQDLDKDLRKARSVVRAARRDIKGRIDDVFNAWRQADLKGE